MTSASHVRRLASIAFSIGCLARLVPEQQLDVDQSAKYPAATFADGNLLGPPGLFGSTVVTKSASPGDKSDPLRQVVAHGSADSVWADIHWGTTHCRYFSPA